MARKAREKSSTGKYAIMLKGTEENLFKSKSVRDLFMEYANKGFENRMLGIRFTADRAVMLVKESEKGISADMKPITISFARAYNKDRGGDGKVFADRFKSLPVETAEFEADCTAFIGGNNAKDPFETKTVAVKTEKAVAKPKKAAAKVKESVNTETVNTEPVNTEPVNTVKATTEVKPQVKAEVEPIKKIGRDKSNDLPYWLL